MNTDITQALQTARYNELVHIYVSSEDDDTESREIVLKASLDTKDGGIQWNPLQGDSDSLTKQHLCTKRWFFPMLNDHVRNRLYDQAIQCASEEVVRRFCSQSTKRHHAVISGLDIGSGTGLLAMLSARHLDQSLKSSKSDASISITSLEMSHAMAQLAQSTVSSNLQGNQIQVLGRHSCEMEPLQPKAHLCTSELLESGLLAEGWLPAMRDAWNRHLHPQAVVVPQRARIYAQLVEGDSLSNYWGPHKVVTDFPNNRQMILYCTEDGGEKDYLLGPTSTTSGVQIAMQAKQVLADKHDPLKLLSDPIRVLDFDVTSKEALPPREGQSRMATFLPTASGRAQAVLFWWELDLYGENHVYSTKHDEKFQDHWHQCLFVFAKLKEQCVELIEGEPAMLKAMSDDSRITFDVLSTKKNPEERTLKRLRLSTEDKPYRVSSDRAWQLNDLDRTSKIRDGILQALQDIGIKDSVVLDVSDFSLGSSMAALLGAPQVFSVESSSSALPLTTARLAQISNGLPLKPLDSKGFQILQCHPEQLTTNVLGGLKPNVVVAEPYYEVLEGWHLHEALNYFYIVRALKERGVLGSKTCLVPATASIMVCAFESSDLGGAYKHCDNICGFEHDVINDRAPLFDLDIRFPAWQYDITPLSKGISVAIIDYQKYEIIETPVVHAPLTRSGTCHGLLVWIDYGILLEGGRVGVLSTKGRAHQQIIRMLSRPVEVEQSHVTDSTATLSCKFLLQSGGGKDYDLQFDVKIKPS